MVINDTQEILDLFRAILEDEGGYEVTLCGMKPHMIEDIKAVMPDLLISDHVFGEEKFGWQLVQRLKMDRDTARIPIIICSAAVKELRELEGYLTEKNVGILIKPFDVDELLALVASKLNEGVSAEEEEHRLRKKNEKS
jgi:CheY-like chemotaxis protein